MLKTFITTGSGILGEQQRKMVKGKIPRIIMIVHSGVSQEYNTKNLPNIQKERIQAATHLKPAKSGSVSYEE